MSKAIGVACLILAIPVAMAAGYAKAKAEHENERPYWWAARDE
jgi:hypothetical protein